jgi:putative ABC transport system permease protein
VIEGPYFDAVGIPLLHGRTFGPDDAASAPRRVVISQQLVQVLFPDEDPIGKTIRVAGGQAEIIGVVGDVALGPRAARRPYVYHSHTQYAADRNWALTQVVAFDRDRAPSLSDVRRDLAQIDPGARAVRTADAGGGDRRRRRAGAIRLAAPRELRVAGLVLAAIGLYGVLSYAVTRRRREMGIRLALGAPVSAVRLLVVGDGGRLALFGIGAGIAIALAATRVLRSLLFDVTATEPLVFAGAAGVLAVVAIAASWIPARAATKLDPAQAVRD